MDVSLLIRKRLQKLGLEQKDLAAAAEVTESYISQLLTRKKVPPAPGRTDIYEKIAKVLQLPSEELAKLATLQRQEGLRKKAGDPTRPLFEECRELVLRKCVAERRSEIDPIFAKEPFGELERLITQTLLDVAQGVAKAELRNENWQRRIAPLSGWSYEQMRVAMLEFLDTDVFSVSVESCIAFLDTIVDSWDMDLGSFSIDVVLNPQLASTSRRRFAFSEQRPSERHPVEPGLERFLNDPSLSGDATEEEIEFLKALTFRDRHPSAFYYYRELQNLRDPLHFPGAAPRNSTS
ncbi:MAG TPA: helix-turn-helix transcriptional regulator [Bryobacteraceae bacterium]|nr:helix-turn-helix transcriptional regulator [Bryobacteraceae bacterium]